MYHRQRIHKKQWIFYYMCQICWMKFALSNRLHRYVKACRKSKTLPTLKRQWIRSGSTVYCEFSVATSIIRHADQDIPDSGKISEPKNPSLKFESLCRVFHRKLWILTKWTWSGFILCGKIFDEVNVDLIQVYRRQWILDGANLLWFSHLALWILDEVTLVCFIVGCKFLKKV